MSCYSRCWRCCSRYAKLHNVEFFHALIFPLYQFNYMYKLRNIPVYVEFKFTDSSIQINGKTSGFSCDIIGISCMASTSNENCNRLAAARGVVEIWWESWVVKFEDGQWNARKLSHIAFIPLWAKYFDKGFQLERLLGVVDSNFKREHAFIFCVKWGSASGHSNVLAKSF